MRALRQPLRRTLGLRAGLLGLGICLAAAGCGEFMTDAATRLGNEVVRNANILRKSNQGELTFVYHPKASPEGCQGEYGIKFQESLHHPASGGSLLVRCGSEDSGSDYRYGTTVHLNAVRVPAELTIEKAAGADLKITLRKNGDAIELVRLE